MGADADRTAPGLSFDFATLAPETRYKLLTGLVVPRPIAWVTTRSDQGVVNAAPFSFFNVFADDPPLLVLGIDTKPDARVKDTLANIHQTRAFVVHMVDEASATQMNDSAIDFPPEIGEPEALGLALTPGTHGPVPRLAVAPVAMECRQGTTLNFGPRRDLVIGEVLALHARNGILDPQTLRTDYAAYTRWGGSAGRCMPARASASPWSGRAMPPSRPAPSGTRREPPGRRLLRRERSAPRRWPW